MVRDIVHARRGIPALSHHRQCLPDGTFLCSTLSDCRRSMTYSTSGFHHSRPSRAVAESTCRSERSRQAIKIRSCQHARVLYQAHAQLRFTESSISSFGTTYEVLTLGGVPLQWSLRQSYQRKNRRVDRRGDDYFTR
jgi:hypothetical protein